MRATGIQINFEVTHRFQGHAQLQVLRVIRRGRRGNGVGNQQPIVCPGPLDVRVIYHTKGEVEARRECAWCLGLPESVAHRRQKSRQRHGVVVTIAHTDVAHHHQQARHRLCRSVPTLILQRLFRQDGNLEFQGRIDLILDADGVWINLLVLQLIGFAILCACRNDEPFALLAVVHGDGGVGQERDLLLKSFLVLGQLFLLRLCSGILCRTSGSVPRVLVLSVSVAIVANDSR